MFFHIHLFRHTLLVPFLLLFIALGLGLSACDQPAGDANPALPDGFAELVVPDAPLIALIYLNQGSEVSLGGQVLDLPAELNVSLSVDYIVVYVGPSKDSTAVEAHMTTEAAARAVRTAVQNGSDDVEWSRVQVTGSVVFIAKGDVSWADAITDAFRDGQTVLFSDAYPDAWETAQFLPSSPPVRPVAIGALLDTEAIQGVMAEAEMSVLRAMSTVLRIVPTEGGIIFTGYTGQSLALDSDVDLSFLDETEIRTVVIVRTRLLGPLLSPILGTLAGALNLEQVQIGEKEAFRYRQGGATALVVPRGGTLHIIAAPNSSDSDEDLLEFLDPE